MTKTGSSSLFYCPASRVVLPIAAFVVFALSGCAVDQNGRFGVNVPQAGSREYQFQSAYGEGVLRPTPDGQYQVQLNDRLQLVDLGQPDMVLVDNVLTVDGRTYVTLRLPRNGCENVYKTLIASARDIDKVDLASDCRTSINFGTHGNSWIAVEHRPHRARFWLMRDGRLQEGLVPDEPTATSAPAAVAPAASPLQRKVQAATGIPSREIRDTQNVSASSSAKPTAPVITSHGPRKLQPTTVSATPASTEVSGSIGHGPVSIDLGQ